MGDDRLKCISLKLLVYKPVIVIYPESGYFMSKMLPLF